MCQRFQYSAVERDEKGRLKFSVHVFIGFPDWPFRRSGLPVHDTVVASVRHHAVKFTDQRLAQTGNIDRKGFSHPLNCKVILPVFTSDLNHLEPGLQEAVVILIGFINKVFGGIGLCFEIIFKNVANFTLRHIFTNAGTL